MQAMLCVLRRPGVDFPEMVGRLEGKVVGTFGALNLPSIKCKSLASTGAHERWSEGYLVFYLHRGR